MKVYSYKNYFKNDDESEELKQDSEYFEKEFEELEQESEELEQESEELEQESEELEQESEELEKKPEKKFEKQEAFEPYLILVKKNIYKRKGPGENYKRSGFILKNDVFKILEEKKDENNILWGKIKSGWIPLTNVESYE